MAKVSRVGLLEPGRDLGEARVTRDERRAAARGRLGGDHPERLRKDRRHDGDVGERKQMDEVAVLERPGEQRARGRLCFQHGPIRRTRRSRARVECRSASSSSWTPFCAISFPK